MGGGGPSRIQAGSIMRFSSLIEAAPPNPSFTSCRAPSFAVEEEEEDVDAAPAWPILISRSIKPGSGRTGLAGWEELKPRRAAGGGAPAAPIIGGRPATASSFGWPIWKRATAAEADSFTSGGCTVGCGGGGSTRPTPGFSPPARWWCGPLPLLWVGVGPPAADGQPARQPGGPSVVGQPPAEIVSRILIHCWASAAQSTWSFGMFW
uniref:Uncharacterized protein n=1 Tax=Anopheles merus TaxID=30066 RepID=A0A182UT46_ANOME